MRFSAVSLPILERMSIQGSGGEVGRIWGMFESNAMIYEEERFSEYSPGAQMVVVGCALGVWDLSVR